MKFRFASKILLKNNHKTLFSTCALLNKDHYKLVVIGGGAGGAATSSIFGTKLGKSHVATIEPNETHDYQPLWTFVGGGIEQFPNSAKPMNDILTKSTWIIEKASEFKPDKNLVITDIGREVEYDYLVVAMGLQLRFDLVKGLPEAFSTPGVSTNYHKDYVRNTFVNLQNFQNGNAIFTYPNTPIKCAGAAQKIMYLADDYFRKSGKRDKANFMFNTALRVMFTAPKYAAVLAEICKKRNINVNFGHTLAEIKAHTKEAVFNVTDKDNKVIKQETFPYSFIHVAAPCSTPQVLRNSQSLVDQAGYLNLNKGTLQHVKYPNIFGVGDCTNLPTSKTAAAVAGQVHILRTNLTAVTNNETPMAVYDGYTSCPLLTSYKTCVLAEFDYNGQPLETFPFDQGAERRTMFHLTKDIIPKIYWNGLLTGWWEGPKRIRGLLHLKSS